MADEPDDTRPLPEAGATLPLRTGAAPAADDAGVAPHFPLIGRGTYVVGGEVARGGIGRVLRARDTRLGRTVAIKELLPGRGGRSRFAREAFITARLEHPGIVAVHEAGQWPDGQPFYAMKLVSGRSLAEVIAAARGLSERLGLVPRVTAVAQAIAYAHSRRVLHRDLKPHNVIAGDFDETIVVDWGLAKDMDQPEDPFSSEDARPPAPTAGVAVTAAGDVLGTPPYMPPEQARGEVVDERADVYALGAILYHVLAGEPPYVASPSRLAATDQSRGTPGSAPRTERSAAEILMEVMARPPVPLAELVPDAPPDLLTIAAKAMARAPEQRYPTAAEMAADLHRFQTGQLVSARRYTRWALFKRWARRQRVPLAVATAFLAALVALGAVSLRRVLAARRAAERQRVIADERRAEADGARHQAELRQAELIVQQARTALDRDPTAALAWLKTLPGRAPDWKQARAIVLEAAGRGVATHVWRANGETVWAVAASPDGGWFASASADDSVRLWNRASGDSVELREQDDVNVLAFSPSGKLLAEAGDTGEIHLWEVSATPRLHGSLVGHGPIVTSVSFSPDGARLASSAYDGTVRLWDVGRLTGTLLWRWPGRIEATVFMRDGRAVAAVCDDGVVRIIGLDGRVVRELRTGGRPTHGIDVSHDGAWIALGSFDGAVLLLPAAGGAPRELARLTGAALGVAFSPSDELLAVGGGDRQVHLFEVATGADHALSGHAAEVHTVAFTPDGGALVSAGTDRVVRVWPIAAAQGRVLRARDSQLGVAFSEDGAVVASAGESGEGFLFPIGGGEPRALRGPAVPAHAAFLTSSRLVTVGIDGSLRGWDLASGAPLAIHAPTGELSSYPARSRDGRLLAWTTAAGERLEIYDLIAGKTETLPVTGGRALDFVGAGSTLAFASGNEVRECDAGRCAETQRAIYRHASLVRVIAASNRGRLLASSDRDHVVWLHDLDAGTARPLGAAPTSVARLAFSPDDAVVASGSNGGLIQLWSLRDGTVRNLSDHTLAPTILLFAPDGRHLVSSGLDDALRLWDLESGDARILRGHRGRINAAAFSPDGATLATAGRDGTVRLWTLAARGALLPGEGELRAWLDGTTTVRIDPTGVASSPFREL